MCGREVEEFMWERSGGVGGRSEDMCMGEVGVCARVCGRSRIVSAREAEACVRDVSVCEREKCDCGRKPLLNILRCGEGILRGRSAVPMKKERRKDGRFEGRTATRRRCRDGTAGLRARSQCELKKVLERDRRS